MKKVLSMLALAGILSFTASAEDKAVTIMGEGQCAKCSLKVADSCQNAIVTEKDGKKVTYFLVQNDVSKSFHKKVCSSKEHVKATGTVKEVDGKMEFTPTKLEVVEK